MYPCTIMCQAENEPRIRDLGWQLKRSKREDFMAKVSSLGRWRGRVGGAAWCQASITVAISVQIGTGWARLGEDNGGVGLGGLATIEKRPRAIGDKQ